MDRQQLYDEILDLLYNEAFMAKEVDDGDGNTTLANMGVLNCEDIDVVLNIIEDRYDVWLENITPETTFDQLVDATLALLNK